MGQKKGIFQEGRRPQCGPAEKGIRKASPGLPSDSVTNFLGDPGQVTLPLWASVSLSLLSQLSLGFGSGSVCLYFLLTEVCLG